MNWRRGYHKMPSLFYKLQIWACFGMTCVDTKFEQVKKCLGVYGVSVTFMSTGYMYQEYDLHTGNWMTILISTATSPFNTKHTYRCVRVCVFVLLVNLCRLWIGVFFMKQLHPVLTWYALYLESNVARDSYHISPEHIARTNVIYRFPRLTAFCTGEPGLSPCKRLHCVRCKTKTASNTSAWLAASMTGCFDRPFLLAGTCVRCVKNLTQCFLLA